MKILHVINSLQVGGAEKFVTEFLPLLKSQIPHTDLAVFNDDKTIFRRDLENKGIKIYDICPNNHNYYSFSRIRPLRSLITHYDIIHTHTTPAQLISAIASKGIDKTLITTEHSTNNRRRAKWWCKPFDKWMYGEYSAIIGCASDVTKSLTDYLGNSKTMFHTISNGVNIEKFQTAVPDKYIFETFRETKKIFMIGRFMHPKDQATIIKALALLPDDIHAFFAGDGPTKTECQNLANNIGLEKRCHFLGNRSDIPGLLKTASVVVHSSYWEGLPLSIIEAMAAGKPVIATDANGIRNLVKDAGILFPPGNDIELAKAIMRLLDNPKLYNDTLSNCICRAKQYDIKTMAEHYINIYSDLFQQNHNKTMISQYSN